jgi:prepilin-type processing-associated H-X9-DG protein
MEIGSGVACLDAGNMAGAFVNGRETKPRDFTDGLSNTALFSERVIGDGLPSVFNSWTDMYYVVGRRTGFCTAAELTINCRQLGRRNSAHDSLLGLTWLFGGWRQTWYNHAIGPNSRIPDCTANPPTTAGGNSGAYSARSYHDGGVNVALADGSVRFVSEVVNLTVWRALSTRRGGELQSAP